MFFTRPESTQQPTHLTVERVSSQTTLQQCSSVISALLSGASAEKQREIIAIITLRTKSTGFEEQAQYERFTPDLDLVTTLLTKLRESFEVTEEQVRICEGIFIFLVKCLRMRDAPDLILDLTALYHAILPGSAVMAVQRLFTAKFHEIFTDGEFSEQTLGDSDLPYQEIIDAIRGKFDMFGSIADTPILGKLHKFLLYCLSHAIFANIGLDFDALGYSKFEAAAIKRAHTSKLGFAYCLFDALTLFCQQFISSVKVGSFEPFYHTGKSYEDWFGTVARLKIQETQLGDPAPHGFSVFSYRAALAAALEEGSAIQDATVHSNGMVKKRIKALIVDLQALSHKDISRQSAQRDRASPFGVLFAGGTSLGKSTLINVVFQYYAALFGLPRDTSAKYTRNPAEKYWNNFSTAQWCIVMDDIAAQSPSLGVEDPSLREIIGVMNNVAYQPDQASLEDKGRTPVQARLVIATTNTIHLNAHAYFSCPIAIQRRLPFVVHVEVKPQFAVNRMLHPPFTFRGGGRFPDYWILRVMKVVPEDSSPHCTKGKTVLVHTFTSMTNFLTWFGETAKEHEAIQAKMSEDFADIARIEVCALCSSPSYHCGCGYEQEPMYPDSGESSAGDEQYPASTDSDPHASSESDFESDFESATSATQFSSEPIELDTSDAHSVESASDEVDFTGIFPIGPAFEEQSATIVPVGRVHTSWWVQFTIWWDGMIQWTGEDTRSLVYTIHMQAWMILWASISWLTGGLFAILFFDRIYGFFTVDYLEGLLWRFMFRRLGEQVRVRYRPLIHWAKVFGVTTASLYVGARVATYVTRSITPPVVCKSCHTRIEFVHFTTQEKMEADAQNSPVPEPVVLEEQMGISSGVPPVGRSDERVNVWYNADLQVTRLDISPQSQSWKALDRDVVRSKMRNNCLRVDISGPGVVSRRTGLVAMGGNLYAINSHALHDAPWLIMSVSTTNNAGVTSNHNTNVVPSQVWRSPRSDVAFIKFQGLPPFADITHLIAKDSFNGCYDASYVGLEHDHSPYNRRLQRVQPDVGDYAGGTMNYFGAITDTITKQGDCGALLIIWSGFGPILGGLHSLGAPDGNVKSARFFLDDVVAARKALGTTQFQCGEFMLNAPSAVERVILPLHSKSPVRFVEKGTASVFGTLSGPRHEPRSNVQRTLMADLLEGRGFTQKFGPPQMKGWVPWRTALLPMLKKDCLFRQDILDEVVRSFLGDIIGGLDSSDLEDTKPYDLSTALNGAMGVAYVDRMKRTTSAGFPWCTSKQKFLVPLDPTPDLPHGVDITDEIKDRVGEIFTRYAKHQRCHPIFKGNLKDEPTKWKKVAAGKTRVFGGAPLDWSIACRMLFLPLIRLIQNNRYIFETAVGTVAQSREWGELHDYLSSKGENTIAGDFADFDKGMLPMFILAAYEILNGLAAACGYTVEELNAMEGIAWDTAFPTFDFNGDLIEFFGTNPSGHVLTVIINSLVNCLYMRYCYYVLNPAHECTSFKEFVALITYGDDNAMGVHKSVPWFNHTSVQGVLGALGIKYTMADKESESVPYIALHDVSFLKRTWRFDADVGHMLCPLELDSVEKSLMTWVVSKSVAPGAQAVDVLSSACMEMFFHGKSEHERMLDVTADIIHQLGIEAYSTPAKFPTWETLARRYNEPIRSPSAQT